MPVSTGCQNKQRYKERVTHGGGRVRHRQDPCAAVLTQSTNRLRASFVEGASESGLVRGREVPACLVPSQLKCHLQVRVWRQACYIHPTNVSIYLMRGGESSCTYGLDPVYAIVREPENAVIRIGYKAICV